VLKRPTYRLSLLFVLTVIVGVGAKWWSHQLQLERAAKKLLLARDHFFPIYDPHLMVDAVNELRQMSHADALLTLERNYGSGFNDSDEFYNVVVQLVFEPNESCPEDKRHVFRFGKTQTGEFEMKNDLPTLVGWYMYSASPSLIPTAPLADARKWGKVRGGFLNPPPPNGVLKNYKDFTREDFEDLFILVP